MLRCNDAVQLMGSDSGDPLPMRSRIALWTHLAMCSSCRAYRRGMIRIGDLVRRGPSNDGIDEQRADDIIARVRQAADSTDRDSAEA